jgi:hypothetical protein
MRGGRTYPFTKLEFQSIRTGGFGMNFRTFKLGAAITATTVLLAPIFMGSESFAASPSPSPSQSQGASPIQTITPVFSDTNVPKIISLVTSAEKTENLFTLTVQLGVRVYRNTLNSVTITLLPRNEGGISLDPIFQAPCTKLGPISSTTLTAAGELTSLQSRSIDGEWYKESYVFSSQTKLPAGQNICLGKYLISTINIVDAAKKTLTISANQASTAVAKTTLNDVATQTSNIWTKYLELAKCPQAINVNPIVTTSGGKTTTSTPATSPTLRTTCDQTISFTNVYLSIVENSVAGATGTTTSAGTTALPIVDYVSQVKTALDENTRLKYQQESMTKQIESLQRRIDIFQGGGKPSPEASTSGTALPIVDYQKQAKDLQAKVAELTKQLAALSPKATPKASAKPSAKVTAKPSAKVTAKPSAKSTVRSSNSGSNENPSGNNRSRRSTSNKSPTPVPTAKR